MQLEPTIKFGLLGRHLGHSFSKSYFEEKFHLMGLSLAYANFELATTQAMGQFLRSPSSLVGLNVTVPYKQEVLQYVEEQSEEVRAIGAANVLVRLEGGTWAAHNTDAIGLAEAIQAWGHLPTVDEHILVFGTGGAAAAVKYAFLNFLGAMNVQTVGRKNGQGDLTYADLTIDLIASAQWLVNATPVGMYPDVEGILPIPLSGLHSGQKMVDLIYNPAKTQLLLAAESAGCYTMNGYSMLVAQAEAAWRLWQPRL
jgi:shikimate dehydrogenase